MVESAESCKLLFNELLKKLVSYKNISANLVEDSKLPCLKFLKNIVRQSKEEFLEFDKHTNRLDKFLWQYIDLSNAYNVPREVLKILLILSRGQAQVERGFSVNKQLLLGRPFDS